MALLIQTVHAFLYIFSAFEWKKLKTGRLRHSLRIGSPRITCMPNKPVLESCKHASGFVDTQIIDCSSEDPEVRKLLSSGAFYFGRSTLTGASYDLTVNIQNRHLLKAASAGTDDIRLRNDSGLDFLWNGSLMCPLLQWGIKPNDWIVFIICGSFELCTVYCGAEQARMGIISRVSCRRPGTRFHARGVNDRGYVANFVETEQFIYIGTSVASHVQLRGSVPLFWEQPGIQVGSHKIQFSRSLDISLGAYERHFMHILSHYAATAIVNLLGCKQGEAMLSRAYQKLHNQSSFKFIYIGTSVASHVQLRGSVPLFWEQPGIQVGSHKIQFSRSLDISLGAYERHFMHILSHYAATAIVNLLGCKQGEAMLSRAYQKLHNQSSFKDSVSQIVFDYHSEVQSRNSKGLDWLQKQIDHFVLSWGHFTALDGRAEQCQAGAVSSLFYIEYH
ncbi:hypothetical protein AHF37_09213 [Paragonimus kellicotti]|nr:hypothetical protein AHF37_09213 [Paragonimus kellicotti]